MSYSASKAGIIGLTRTLAKELGAKNINVNAVAPGYIQTEMTGNLPDSVREQFLKAVPIKREGTTEDVANLVLFLASDAADYITGEVIRIDGGLSIAGV